MKTKKTDQKAAAYLDRRAIVVLGERRNERIMLASYWNTPKRKKHVSLVVCADEVPEHPHDAMMFILGRCWGGAWPFPPSHRIAEKFRDLALVLSKGWRAENA